jgi:hypothetical protein
MELLTQSHDRDGFDCGSEPINSSNKPRGNTRSKESPGHRQNIAGGGDGEVHGDLDAKRYYEQFGFVPLPTNDLEMFLPVKTIQEALASHP